MPSINKKWSIERLGIQDSPQNYVGFSPFIRWGGPLVAKAGEIGLTRKGNTWVFVQAPATIPLAATVTPAVAAFTTDATASQTGSLLTLGAIGTAGVGYRPGEVCDVLGGYNGKIKIDTVNATGGILTAHIDQNYIGPNTQGPKAVGSGYPLSGNFTLSDPAAPWVPVNVTGVMKDQVAVGTLYRCYAPFDPGEFGWIEKI
jgi:hypothetical protein